MSVRRSLRMLCFAPLTLACGNRVVDCETPGPWPPAHEYEPCNAPRDAATNSLDDPMDRLTCLHGRWQGPHDDLGRSYSVEGDVENGFCAKGCLADMKPDTSLLDVLCSPTAELLLRDSTSVMHADLRACEVTASGWKVPQGNDACFAIAIGPPGAFDAMPTTCRERGDKTAFVIVGDTAAIGTAWTELEVLCQVQIYADGECPGAELPETNCE